MLKRIAVCVVVLCLVFLISPNVFAKEIQGKDDQGRDYWLYAPDTIDPDKTYTLVVGVHGYRGNGQGAAGHAGWVKRHDVIVLGPSYDSNGYQYLQKGSDQQTIDLFKKLRKESKLHDKLFIAGFSGGSQYAHRFAMKYPEIVVGCAAHSGGTWATGDYADKKLVNPKARGVLFVISCGEKDTGKSFDEAPFGRLEWAKKYAGMLDEGGFTYHAHWWPGVGHQYAAGAREQTLDCFTASTQRLPEYKAEREALGKTIRAGDYFDAWAVIKARMSHADSEDEGILGIVHGKYIESLEKEIAKVDRYAEHQVRKIVRDHDDPEALRDALEKHLVDFEGAPKTAKAVEEALGKTD